LSGHNRRYAVKELDWGRISWSGFPLDFPGSPVGPKESGEDGWSRLIYSSKEGERDTTASVRCPVQTHSHYLKQIINT
jgi:hypothetical protein